ncbi:lycopene cyclase domain-containing protein [Polaromonas sp.]|nr:lycopene cyclase domain-containing protein [Candidatus Saccharibacteria bacterium]
MYRYLLLNIVVLALIGGYVLWRGRNKLSNKIFAVMAVLLLMTAVFDSVIIALNLVDYDTSHILGVYIGKAPIEDFAYTIAAAVLVPLLWEQGAKHEKE